MSNKMLIDATHPEETRVVVVKGSRVEEFDFESANRKQLRGNIYLAKVTRVEPSLQAAFVEYGGNRHGFLAFSEIHPDYYQIPWADRQALLDAEEAEAHEDFDPRPARQSRRNDRSSSRDRNGSGGEASPARSDEQSVSEDAGSHDGDGNGHDRQHDASASDHGAEHESENGPAGEHGGDVTEVRGSRGDDHDGDDEDHVESVGAEDAMEEVPMRRKPRARQYKIQEVIKRRQVLLVQVVKEERGNKGAALTTYLSLAGRYSVLMPNTGRGGGISRKITNVADRKRLKEVAHELEVPEGMGVILRTAGASRTKAEIKRDFEYLLRLWENVRDLTLKSSAATLVYEEGSLVKRSIRDLYNKDITQVLVSGDEAYREAKDFMRMLMPSHAKNVQPYRDSAPIFARYSVEPQLDAMFSPQVTLRSGGYIVINQTEALVSIDVNSGRSTREHNIEDTAYQTNMEAAEEVARQLRLRDLAGLIVIDFIDMEESRNNKAVERKLKDCLKNDRARIQVGRISHFGLMEMSRQRIRTGVLEGSTEVCPHCLGAGIVRSTESVALHVLRSLEDQLLKGVTHHLTIRTRTAVALYILNQKRRHLFELEARFGLSITISADEHVTGQHYVLERGEIILNPQPVQHIIHPETVYPEDEMDELEVDETEETQASEETEAGETRDGTEAEGEGESRSKRRRRRRRRRSGDGYATGEQSRVVRPVTTTRTTRTSPATRCRPPARRAATRPRARTRPAMTRATRTARP
ncbi:Rne/Rng family ribonuclease, partial [Methylobrevis pamukkalensis]|uniref:Rne/Rng family ribonuclease n=1 Tax=Methylobrevis pamukkalensis TaxID=1439726 RepID=UPI000845FAE1